MRLPPTPLRVLLVNLNAYDQPYPVYPLGLAYIDGALTGAGHETQIWDARMNTDALEAAVAQFAPHVVGVSMRNVDNVQYHNPRSFVQETIDCCARLRAATSAPLVLGGSGFSVFPREIFELTGVDFGIQGEGEQAFLALLTALQNGGVGLAEIPGLFWREDGQVRTLRKAPNDAVFVNAPRHRPEVLAAYNRQGSLPGVQTQRGCPLRCTYCTYPLIEGKKSRYCGGADVVEEMRRLKALGVSYTFIVDSVFNTRPDHVAEICEALIAADLKMSWQCFLRPRGATRELLTLMQRAGMKHVEFGSDSFSDPVLKAYGKSFTFAEIQQASEAAHALGLHYSHFIIFGGPGETWTTVEETIARANALPGAYYFATIGMRIYPETPLWRSLNPEAKGETPADYLLQPRFHLAPGFTVADLYARLDTMRREHHNWVIGDPPPEFVETIGKLRSRGVQGPAWEYIELLQRLAAARDSAVTAK